MTSPKQTYSQAMLSPSAAYGYIPGLNGLRAIAVLIVIAAHFGISNLIPGGFGVTVFFFISGFLITRLLIAEKKAKGKIGLKQFYIRRLIRLYPALIAMVIPTTAYFMLMGYGGPTLTEFSAALGYFTNFFQVSVRSAGDPLPFMSWTHLWSLAVEEHFYLVFPLIVVACGVVTKSLRNTLIAIVCIVPLWRLYIASGGLNVSAPHYNYMMSDARFDSLAWGCLLTVLLDRARDIKKFKALIGWAPIVAALGLLALSFLWRDEMFRQVARYSVQGIALFILVLNLYFFRRLQFSFKILEWPPIAWIGTVSYGLYLWHYPVLDATRRLVDSEPVTLAIATVASLAVTALSFYAVEQPFTALRKRFGAHIVKREAASPQMPATDKKRLSPAKA